MLSLSISEGIKAERSCNTMQSDSNSAKVKNYFSNSEATKGKIKMGNICMFLDNEIIFFWHKKDLKHL